MRSRALLGLLLASLASCARPGSGSNQSAESVGTPTRAVALAAPSTPPAPGTPAQNPATATLRPTATSAGTAFSGDDYALHVEKLRVAHNLDGFTIVVQPPFVVVGDEAPERVQGRARETIKWTVDRLKQDFFERNPSRILTIWLFRDKASYESNARRLFGTTPSTPYGYYSAADNALVMNIATGGGTLVHEIVHPFMEANFSSCPTWFNEGLGSLFEQCGDQRGHIRGYTNWRLEGLQKAIRGGQLPSFERLLAMDETEFYQGDRGTNYAQARYLCYYLQEKGLLVRFYRDFLAARDLDPTGVATLRRVLGTQDLVAFQSLWETYVLALRFP